nr:MAG TPA: hypothetical protein [Caudoviricetes sp.]
MLKGGTTLENSRKDRAKKPGPPQKKARCRVCPSLR